MPWSRFWELSLGAVLAYVEFNYAKQLYQFKDSKFYKTVLAIIFRNPSDSDNQKMALRAYLWKHEDPDLNS